MEPNPIQEAASAIHAAALWEQGEGHPMPAHAMKVTPGAALDIAINALKETNQVYLPQLIRVMELLKTFTPV